MGKSYKMFILNAYNLINSDNTDLKQIKIKLEVYILRNF